MPHPSEPLRNVRHEKFCLALAEGMSQASAYQHAGFKETASSRANAARLIAKDNIRERLAHLQRCHAQASEVSVASLLSELELARSKAVSLDQLSAAVKATAEKARISGLLVQRIEVSSGNNLDYDSSTEDIANEMLAGVGSPIEQFRPVDLKDREGLIDLLERVGREIHEYLASIKARPIVATRVDVTKLPARWQDLELHAQATQPRLTNGRR